MLPSARGFGRAIVDGFAASGDPDLTATDECPCCGFDSMLTFPMFWVRWSGVTPIATHIACVRCLDEGCTCSQ